MTAFALKTPSEQKMEWLKAERAVRRLTNDEWEELRRAEHAIYCRARLARIRKEELELLRKVERESCQVDPGRYEH